MGTVHIIDPLAGLRVEKFSCVCEYANIRRDSPPDCVILDVMLSGRTTGLEFFGDCRNWVHRDAPVIFISGYADVPVCVQAMKAGAFESLTNRSAIMSCWMPSSARSRMTGRAPVPTPQFASAPDPALRS
jgi:ActR/RegA family two-component response regulator